MNQKDEYTVDEVIEIVSQKMGTQIGGLEDKKYRKEDIEEIVDSMLKIRAMEKLEKGGKDKL